MSNSVCLDNTLLAVHVEVEGTVADLQPEGIEGSPTYEQVNVLGSWLTLGDTFCETAVSTAYLHDDLVDVFLVDVPERAGHMVLDLARKHDAQHQTGGLDELVALLHHVVVTRTRHNGMVDAAVAVDDVGNLVKQFSLHSPSCRIWTTTVRGSSP